MKKKKLTRSKRKLSIYELIKKDIQVSFSKKYRGLLWISLILFLASLIILYLLIYQNK